jgi:hypothetical protein
MDKTYEQERKAMYAWQDADNAWQAELERTYKSKAGDARYNRKLSVATPELARLHTAFQAARATYYDIREDRVNAALQNL